MVTQVEARRECRDAKLTVIATPQNVIDRCQARLKAYDGARNPRIAPVSSLLALGAKRQDVGRIIGKKPAAPAA